MNAIEKMAAGGTEMKLEKSAKTDVVSGQACELWTVTHGAEKTEMCVVRGLVIPVLQPGAPQMSWSGAVDGEGAFPVRAVTRDASGAEVVRVEATRLERKAIDDAKFALPAGYRTIAGLPGLGAIPTHK
jgi:hypothetical protein